MLCCSSGTTYDVITFLICTIQKREYLQNEKRYAKEENAILLYSKKPFQTGRNYFLPHRHFKVKQMTAHWWRILHVLMNKRALSMNI